MNSNVIQQILAPLVGLQLRCIGRAADLLWVQFGELRELPDLRGRSRGRSRDRLAMRVALTYREFIIILQDLLRIDSARIFDREAVPRIPQNSLCLTDTKPLFLACAPVASPWFEHRAGKPAAFGCDLVLA
jgi:hypothetical protein